MPVIRAQPFSEPCLWMGFPGNSKGKESTCSAGDLGPVPGLGRSPSVEDSRVPWTARRSNQSILKEISSEYSLEGLILKLKLKYFGHLM